MHPGRDVDSFLDGCEFLFSLVVALCHDGLGKLDRRGGRYLGCLQSEQFVQPYLVLPPVRIQEMDLLALGPGSGDVFREAAHRKGVGHTDPGALLAERRLGALPYYVVDGEIVAEDDLPVFVNVDDSRKRRVAEAEEIEEGTVLTEGIGVVKIVHRSLPVAEEKKKTLAHILLEAGTS